jgi:hypothetical protein
MRHRPESPLSGPALPTTIFAGIWNHLDGSRMVMFLPANATFRRLAFTDFRTRTLPAPAPGASTTGAQTAVNMNIRPNSFHFRRAAHLKPPNFMMVEDPNVTVTLNTAQMWVASWVLTSPVAFQTSLLNHEQGHYEISMLNAGDVFHELLTISGGAFASAQAGAAAIRGMRRRLFNVQPIHDKYDLDTNHGLNATMQAAWDTALSNARVTFVRPSLRTALATAGLFR